MTIEEAKKKYGSNGNGYVFCCDCPIKETDACLCTRDDTNSCTGYSDVHEAIAEYMTKQEATSKPNDIINHPSHYCRDGGMESIDEMVLVFGKEAVKNFCLCNVWKYRYRSSEKNGTEDLKKSDWYMRKYKELSNE